MTELQELPRTDIRLRMLSNAPRNSNKMSEFKYAGLKAFIAKYGVAQDVVAYRIDGSTTEWQIVDGHHRVRAMRELGIDPETVITVRDASGLDEAERLELTLSLNNNRGEPDLGMVSLDLDFLIENGRTYEDFSLIGFDADEAAALVGATGELTEEDLLSDAMDLERERPDDKPAKVFTLELVLSSAKELRLAKNRLRRAGGKGNKDLAKGFRALAGIDEDDR